MNRIDFLARPEDYYSGHKLAIRFICYASLLFSIDHDEFYGWRLICEFIKTGESDLQELHHGVSNNTRLDVYIIVDDPHNAPLAIMNQPNIARAALADVAAITKAANLRRGMDDYDIAKLGDEVAGGMRSIKKVTGSCTV
ncbi:hypothetical protein BBP40_011071 [Aspergillus hancockii]|nr:hypothetical protein BBP40_011071 [Aspergillus hancockii]